MGEDQSQTGRRRLTVAEASEVLGVTVEAVRGRIKRGTLHRDELIAELRARIEDLRTDRDAWRDQARHSDYMASAAFDRTRELEDRLRELEAPSDERESPSEATEQPRSAENQRNASARGPQATEFALVPHPRKQTVIPRDQIGDRNLSRSRRLYLWWMRSPFEKYLSYAIGIVLTAGAAGLDFFYSPGGVDIDVLRLLIAVGFGIYVGIKDGYQTQTVGRFNIIGFLTGLLTWMVAAYFSEASLITAYDIGDISPIVSTVVIYVLGTWLLFISGFLLGRAVQIKAQEHIGTAQAGPSPRGEHDATAGEARTTAIMGLVGVIVAALLQTLGQIFSALVGNSGP